MTKKQNIMFHSSPKRPAASGRERKMVNGENVCPDIRRIRRIRHNHSPKPGEYHVG